jgi:hypothetical protein
LSSEPAAKIDMIISFVRDHRIECDLAKDHPDLATLISTRSLPLQLMEDLFEAANKNPLFKMEFEHHIRSCFAIVSSLNVPEQKN